VYVWIFRATTARPPNDRLPLRLASGVPADERVPAGCVHRHHRIDWQHRMRRTSGELRRGRICVELVVECRRTQFVPVFGSRFGLVVPAVRVREVGFRPRRYDSGHALAMGSRIRVGFADGPGEREVPLARAGSPGGAMSTGARNADLSLLSAVQCGALTRKVSLRLSAATSQRWLRSGRASATQVTCRADHRSGAGRRFHEKSGPAAFVAVR